MKVFLDVGANNGQSLAAVLDQGFDRIVCFEPASDCWPKLKELATPRVTIERFGLWNRDCRKPVFQPGSKGAGIWKKDNGRTNDVEVCEFRRASTWVKDHLRKEDLVFLKLNVEGAECDIIDDLLDSSEFERIDYTMVDFDVRKIASQKHREAETRIRLAGLGFPRIAYCKDVMRGPTHKARIQNWLRLVSEAS